MCGISGIFNVDRKQRVQRDVLASMNAQIVHRGPDDEGMLVEENVGLAMRRLSIIDIQSGHQPMSNEDETVWIVFNGEIYNYRELRHDLQSRGHCFRSNSDTETIVHLYEEYGSECVRHLRGMFAFAIWDRVKREIFLARDRLGIKPLYYRFEGAAFLFASEIKAILAHPDVKAEFNGGTLAEYLSFGYVTGSQTMYRGIQKLLPGHTLVLDERGQLQTFQYWDLNVRVDDDGKPRKFYVNRYRELLEECVSSHLMSEVPLGVFLSGGLDSSTMAALTTKIRKEPIETFSVGYGEAEFSELGFARTVAQHIGSRHREVQLSRDEFFRLLPQLIWHEDEPIAWPSSVSLYSVARLAKENVTVVLSGEGSDETLAGYTRYAWTLMNSRADRVYRALTPAVLRRALARTVAAMPLSAAAHRKLDHTLLMRDGESWASFYFDNFFSAFSTAEQKQLLTPQAQEWAGDAYSGSLAHWDHSSGDMLHRLLYTDIKTYLVELLMKQDQMSMAASVESRVPFLDHVLVEFTATIPAQYSIDGLAGKSILKSAVEDLLPHDIIYRNKMGFPTPWAHWLSGNQLQDMEQLLLEGRTLERGYFRPEYVKELLEDHRAGRRDNGNRIWRLLNLELWFRVCVERDGRSEDVFRPAALARK